MSRFSWARGFTIVELLVVIIIIGILASLALIGYNNIQQQARLTKIKNDTNVLVKAIDLAREKTSKSLFQITGSSTTAQACVDKPTGTDLAKLPKTDACWRDYTSALTAVQNAAGVTSLTDMKDPWGRPYMIDENETDAYATGGRCETDYVQAYTYPFVTGYAGMQGTVRFDKNSNASCINQ